MSVSPVSDADVARSGVTTSRTRSPTCLPPYHFSPSSQPHLSSSSQQSNLPLQLISNALSLGPTLLPPQLAQLITALSLATKVSLRATALFIELIIESCRYSTSVGLGLSRRALISAVGSARTFYVVREGLDWAGGKAADSLMSNDSFFNVLDKYTNLGIYLITHTFTLAELFAMSGFYLTSTTLKTGVAAAQESVSLFDGIFGSNESSRALSSIITLLRREFGHDDRFAQRNKGNLASLSALTKAMTAFACLQNVTWRRTVGGLKQKVLYDCIVVGQLGEDYGSEEINRAPDPRLESGGTAQERQLLNYHPPPSSPSSPINPINSLPPHHSQPHSSSPRNPNHNAEADDELVRGLQALVGEDADEELALRGPDGRIDFVEGEDGELYEITEQVTETEIETRTVEHYNLARGEGVVSEECSEVEALTQLAQDEDGMEVPGSGNDRAVARTVASKAYADALERPQASSMRVQIILKTITRKLLERKRTIKRLHARDSSTADSFQTAKDAMQLDSDFTATDEMDETETSPSPSESDFRLNHNGSSASVDVSASHSRTLSSAFPTAALPLATPPNSPDISYTKTLSPAWANERSASETSEETSEGQGRSLPSRMFSKAKKSFLPKTPFTSSSFPADNTPSFSRMPISNAGPSSMLGSSSSGFSFPSSPILSASASTSSSSFVPPRPRHHPTSSSQSSIPQQPKRKTPRLRQPSSRSVHTQQSHYTSSTQAPSSASNDANPEGLFPQDHLIKNVHRYCRYSSAAYGQNFLRVLGLGATEFMFPTTGRHHANSWAFAHHTNLPIDALLLSSYVDPSPNISQEKLAPLVHYIAVDHSQKAIVLTCRGTLGLSDVLVDLTCDYEPIQVEGGAVDEEYSVHGGMLYSARKLMAATSTIHETIREALEAYPSYGLVLCGHSLGGGVAALLSILWSCPTDYFLANVDQQPNPSPRPSVFTPFVTNFSSGLPPGRPIHSYVYGPPAIASSALSRHTRGLVTSVVQGNDIVPTLSLGVLRDFKNVAVTLTDEGSIAEEIVGRVVGIHQRRLRESFSPSNLLLGGGPSPVSVSSRSRSESSPRVTFDAAELAQGRSRNAAAEPDYRDPTGPEGGSASRDGIGRSPEVDAASHEQKMLDDWFFSLIKTMRADMSHEKLYPAGSCYTMEHWTVFVNQTPSSSRQPHPKSTHSASNHKEAHRVVLKLVEDIEKRFGEPVFSKTMFQDHLPTKYEHSTQLLYDGLFG